MSSTSTQNVSAVECVGAVVIGRNEGDRLRSCLESVLPQAPVTVYVDSGSSDASVALASRMGADTIELSTSAAFTAARARNAGWKRVLELNPRTEYVQFVDGDCVLEAEWVGKATDAFATNPQAAIIYGHVRETRPDRNVYHRLAAIEWDTPIGQTKYCGGIAMVRMSALSQVNGYRGDLIAGEEPELCVRLRQAGWAIIKLDQEMASHDSDIDSFRLWWNRSVRAGRAYAEGASLHGTPPERHWVKETRSIWIWGLVVPLLGVSLAALSHGISLAVMVVLYLTLAMKIVINQVRSGRALKDASLYSLACILGKWPQAIGMLAYVWNKSTTGNMRRIELSEHCRQSGDRL